MNWGCQTPTCISTNRLLQLFINKQHGITGTSKCTRICK